MEAKATDENFNTLFSPFLTFGMLWFSLASLNYWHHWLIRNYK